MSNWYEITNDFLHKYKYIYIYLNKLTNDILNTCEIIPEEYNNLEWWILYDTNLDFELLMSKLIYCKKLFISSKLNSSFKLPQNLVEYHDNFQNNILEFPNTLKVYKCSHCMIPENLQLSLEKVIIKTNSLNNTFYNIPSSVTELYISINTIEIENILWSINLKSLTLHLNTFNTNSIGILPYGLEYFDFHCVNYDYPIVLPPTVITFKFICVNEYKFDYSLNGLPDSIVHLELYYMSCPRISRLPKSCKKFMYHRCFDDIILDTLKYTYPTVNITK